MVTRRGSGPAHDEGRGLARAPSRAAERAVVAALADLLELERFGPAARLPAAHRAVADALQAIVADLPPGLAGPFLADLMHQGEVALWSRRRGDWDVSPYLVPGRRPR